MSVKIGIPRGMYFYKYYSFVEAFLTELGAELIVSPKTNKEILDNGSRYCIDDACLPVKVYHGHVFYLRDKVDYMLIPRLTSVSFKEYICPKFGGLPEMIKYSIPTLPPILDLEIDMYNGRIKLYKSLVTFAYKFTRNPKKIRNAFNNAFNTHCIYKSNLLKGYLPTAIIDKENIKNTYKDAIIGIVSHPYLLYDSFINMDLLEKLDSKHIKYYTPEIIDSKQINEICSNLGKRMFWSSGKNIIGAALYMMSINNIEGILILTSFACGIDSLSIELIKRKTSNSYHKPIMIVTLDEHTGEANFNTRLEAFLDLIERRKGFESNLSTHGRSLYSS